VPLVVRWPGVIKPGTEINEIVSHEDWLPTLMAGVGAADTKAALVKGATVGGVPYKVHLDGYNLLPSFKGEAKEWPRKEFLYWTDDGNLAGLRYQQFKIAFMEQRAHGFDVWQEPMVTLRLPKLFNLRSDPFERADHEGMGYSRWRIDRAFVLVPAQTYVGNWLQSFKDFPPRQKPGSFNLGDAMAKLSQPAPGSN
jgi:arylsulfatase